MTNSQISSSSNIVTLSINKNQNAHFKISMLFVYQLKSFISNISNLKDFKLTRKQQSTCNEPLLHASTKLSNWIPTLRKHKTYRYIMKTNQNSMEMTWIKTQNRTRKRGITFDLGIRASLILGIEINDRNLQINQILNETFLQLEPWIHGFDESIRVSRIRYLRIIEIHVILEILDSQIRSWFLVSRIRGRRMRLGFLKFFKEWNEGKWKKQRESENNLRRKEKKIKITS